MTLAIRYRLPKRRRFNCDRDGLLVASRRRRLGRIPTLCGVLAGVLAGCLDSRPAPDNLIEQSRGAPANNALVEAVSASERTASEIHRTAVTSSAMKSVGYDADGEILAVEFPNGSVYEYLDVPSRVYQELMAADSKGRYFQAHIRNVYKFVRQ